MPENRTRRVSSLCSLGALPVLVTGFLRQLLITQFSTAANIENPTLRSKLWSAIPTETAIEIESVTRWKPQTTEFRPSVILARNDWKVLRRGINDQMMGERWDATGIEHYAAYFEGSHTLFCLSNLATEAEILGAEVFRTMIQFGPVIRTDMELHRFVTVGVGKVFEIEEARSNYAVPVTVAYAAEDRWFLQPLAPVLKRIDLSTFLP